MQAEMISHVEREMKSILATLEGPSHGEMGEMARFHLGWTGAEGEQSGKRIRPLLTLLVCQSAGGDWSVAVPAAAAIELIHNFSLIHDDIEDASSTRRGKPTLWKQWDLPQALNTGDALLILSQTAPHRLLDFGVSSRTVLKVLRILDEACLELTIGQHMDLAFERRDRVSVDEYLRMISGKTASLLGAAAATGALLAGAPPAKISEYEAFGKEVGLAFQIEDDILGIWGEPDKTGKPAGDDLLSRKKSLPVVHGLEASPEFRELWDEPNRSPAHIPKLRQSLMQAGSDEFSRQQAAQHTTAALERLNKADPSADGGAQLRQLASKLLKRET
jgi:geranylgeranyl diphosphate synthase type I